MSDRFEGLGLHHPADCCSTQSRTGELLAERYEVMQKLGQGGMGEVYAARHRDLGCRFAVKFLHPELARSAKMLRRFSREALSASRLESDHIVGVLDCGYTAEGVPYYVMELLRGVDLRHILRDQGPLATTRAVKLAVDVCRGLKVAHAAGLIHRDLKPENIFVVRHDDGRESAKILDFGLVQLGSGMSSSHSGGLVGTLRYMSPEQARGDGTLDARTDIHALGAVLYECLAGRVPYSGDNIEEVLFNILNGKIRPLRELRPELPTALQAAVSRALAALPSDRYAGAREFAESLQPFAGASIPSFRHQRSAPAADTTTARELSLEFPTSALVARSRRATSWRAFAAASCLALGAAASLRFLESHQRSQLGRILASSGVSVAARTIAIEVEDTRTPTDLPHAAAAFSLPLDPASAASKRAPSARVAGRTRNLPQRVSTDQTSFDTPHPAPLFDPKNPY